MAPGPASARARLDALLGEMFAHPERREAIVRTIDAEFERDCAVLVLDSCGFSRTTRAHGIHAFLLMLHQLRRLAEPVIAGHGGRLVKAEADNLYCLFDDTAGAIGAAEQVMEALDDGNRRLPAELQLYASIGIASGRVLDLAGEDLWGEAVNLACKLGEDLAGRGMILLSEQAYAAMGAERPAGRPASASVSGLRLDYRVLREAV